jgi:hypothetical protein
MVSKVRYFEEQNSRRAGGECEGKRDSLEEEEGDWGEKAF